MGLCRSDHVDYGDKVQFMEYLYRIHRSRLIERGAKYDHEWMEAKIKQAICKTEMKVA